MYENINIEFDAGIVTITLNRPEKLNALAGHMRRDLAEALEHAGSDPEVRVVVLTGAGRAFCTGADVRRMSELMEAKEVEEFKRLLGAGRRAGYMSEHGGLERMLQYETGAQSQCFHSREERERVRAFLERRTPRDVK